MEWTLRLVGTGIDRQSRSFDVMAIRWPDGLDEIADLGLTLDEAKLLPAKVQQQALPRRPTIVQCFAQTVSPVASLIKRRDGGRIGLRRPRQLNRNRNESMSHIAGWSYSLCVVDASLLSPDPEPFGPCSSIAGGSHAVTPGLEVAVDDAVS
jgi:hypothetical protein